jgi:transcriptional regulator with XRE-family HTH domain
MTATELRDALESLGITQAEAARILGIDRRTIRRYLAGPDAPSGRAIPVLTAKILRLALAGKLTVADVEAA